MSASSTAPPPSETTPPRREAFAHRGALEGAEVRLAVRARRAAGIGPCSRDDGDVGVDERTSERLGDAASDAGLARAHRPDEDDRVERARSCCGESRVARGRACAASPGSPRGRPRGCGASRDVSPPNFSSTTSASTSATMASATTPGGGHGADVGALVVRGRGVAGRDVDRAQRVRHGGDRLHAGAHAQHGARGHAALGAARPVGRAGDAVVGRRTARRAPAEPRRVVVRKPSPTSTPLIAWMLMSACASLPSSRRSQCTCEPSPGGRP